MPLTDLWLKKALNKTHPATQVVTDRDGLGVRVTPRGRITFQLRYRIHGRQGRMDLGTYPLMTLRAARDESLRLRGLAEQGYDPKEEQLRERRERDAHGLGLEAAYRQWHTAYCLKQKKQANELLRSFELHVFPTLGAIPIRQLTLADWLPLLEPLAEQRPTTAKKVLANSKQLYRWLKRRRLVEDLPLADINARTDLHVVHRSRSRRLSDGELVWLWDALVNSRIMRKNKLFLALCLHFGCRNSEVRLSEPSHWDLDAGIWTVPAENHKQGYRTGEPLIRPIIDEVKPWIDEALCLATSSTTVFATWDSDEAMGRSATLRLPYGIRKWLESNRGVQMPHWSMHDLRRTMRTNLSPLVDRHIAELCLGHALPDVEGVYDRFAYLDEKRDAYQKWWHHVDGLTHGVGRL